MKEPWSCTWPSPARLPPIRLSEMTPSQAMKEQQTMFCLSICLLHCYSFRLPGTGNDTCGTSCFMHENGLASFGYNTVHPSIVEVATAAVSQAAKCLGPVLKGSWQLLLFLLCPFWDYDNLTFTILISIQIFTTFPAMYRIHHYNDVKLFTSKRSFELFSVITHTSWNFCLNVE